MILIPGVEKKKIGVYGLGATGISVCEALVASGAEVFCWDEASTARQKTENTRYDATQPKDWPWEEITSLVVSPGIPLTHPKPHVIVRKARQEKIEVIGDIELFARALNVLEPSERPRVIGITGSNGKSTTTALIGHVLKETGRNAHIGGNIGTPLLDLPPFKRGAIYVLELSSYQLDLAKTFRADTAILLNIAPDHLERHGSMANYIKSKKKIFDNQTSDDVLLLGVDDVYCQSVCAEISASKDNERLIRISSLGSLGSGAYALKGRLFYNVDGKSGEAGDVSAIPALRGPHNWQNACAALAAVIQEGVAANIAVKAMERYQGLPHRLEQIGERDGVLFINDSKATNADAARQAILSFDDVFWIAGGQAKEGGVESLRSVMSRVRGVYLIGEASKEFEAQLAGSAPCYQCGELEKAVSRATRDAAQAGLTAPVVLFSPAAASFDQFKNFEARGAAFRDLVKVFLIEQKSGASEENGEAA